MFFSSPVWCVTDTRACVLHGTMLHIFLRGPELSYLGDIWIYICSSFKQHITKEIRSSLRNKTRKTKGIKKKEQQQNCKCYQTEEIITVILTILNCFKIIWLKTLLLFAAQSWYPLLILPFFSFASLKCSLCTLPSHGQQLPDGEGPVTWWVSQALCITPGNCQVLAECWSSKWGSCLGTND